MQPFSSRQLYPPVESPSEGAVGAQHPNENYPDNNSYPVSTGEPGFVLGQLCVEMPGHFDLLLRADVLYRNPLVDADAQQGLGSGDLTGVGSNMPDFFWEPTEYYRVQAEPIGDRQLTINYRDFAAKHPDLRKPYQVTLIVEYVETHPEVEAVADATLRARIYEDLLNSDFTCLPIDVAKYQADPMYSAVAELRQRYAAFLAPSLLGAGPSVESIILNSLTR